MKPSERRTALKELARQLPSLIEVEKNHWKNQRRVLIVTNSYRDSEAMEEVFSRSPLQGRIKSLTRKIKDSIHVTRPRLMEVAKEVDALITPLSAMNRGVNLVDENRKALFGTALFVSRPYPPPQDIAYILSFIHSRIPSLILQVQREGLSGKEALSCFRKICHAIFEKMHDEPNFWMQLSDEERLDLAWYLFVPIWQMAGRLVRGECLLDCCISIQALLPVLKRPLFFSLGINCLSPIRITGFTKNYMAPSCPRWSLSYSKKVGNEE